MFKGFLSGIFWGTMVGGLVLAVLSLYTPLPQTQVTATASEEPAKEMAAEVEPETPAVTEGAPETPAVSEEESKEDESTEEGTTEEQTPATDDDQSGVIDATPSEDAPVVAEKIDAVPQEAAPAKVVADVIVIDSEAVVEAAEGIATQSVAPTVDTEVASLAAPIVTTGNIKLPQVGDASVSSPKLPNAVVIVDRSRTDLATETPANPIKEPPVVALNEAPEELKVAAVRQSGPVPRIVQVEEGTPSRLTPLLNAPEISELSPDRVESPNIIRVAASAQRQTNLPQVVSEAPATTQEVSADTPIGVPVEPLLNPLEQSGIQVVTGRLPSISRSTTAPATQTSLPTQTAPTNNPLIDFASPFETNAQSLFSIVIIDAGDAGVPRDQLLNSSYPITVAIDPTQPNATSIMQEYRAAGKEVIALINDLPLGAAPTDVAVAVQGYLNVLDEAVAIMDPLDARIRDDSALLQPVLNTIEQSGQGFLTYTKGLNTARQAAQRSGVPSGLVFRVLDSENERAPKIKRYLKRAAFNAGKDGSVVVVGHSYSETMTALLEWALEQNDRSLAIAPLSAILKSDQAQGS